MPRLLELGRPSEAEHILQERISSKPRAMMQAIHSHKNGHGHGLLREGTTSRSSHRSKIWTSFAATTSLPFGKRVLICLIVCAGMEFCLIVLIQTNSRNPGRRDFKQMAVQFWHVLLRKVKRHTVDCVVLPVGNRQYAQLYHFVVRHGAAIDCRAFW